MKCLRPKIPLHMQRSLPFRRFGLGYEHKIHRRAFVHVGSHAASLWFMSLSHKKAIVKENWIHKKNCKRSVWKIKLVKAILSRCRKLQPLKAVDFGPVAIFQCYCCIWFNILDNILTNTWTMRWWMAGMQEFGENRAVWLCDILFLWAMPNVICCDVPCSIAGMCTCLTFLPCVQLVIEFNSFLSC
jgi:hypothetical protein